MSIHKDSKLSKKNKGIDDINDINDMDDINNVDDHVKYLKKQQEQMTLHKQKLNALWNDKMNELQKIQSSIDFQLIKIKTLLTNAKTYELNCLRTFKEQNILQVTVTKNNMVYDHIIFSYFLIENS